MRIGILMGSLWLLAAPPALALVGGEGIVGLRWYSLENEAGDKVSVTGRELGVGAYIDPIPLIPVAVGAHVSTVDLTGGDFAAGVKSASHTEVALEAVAWIPMIPVVTPFVKARLGIASQLELEFDDATKDKMKSKLVGAQFHAGVRYSVIPLVSLQLAVAQGVEKAPTLFDKEQQVNTTMLSFGIHASL